MCEGAAGIGSVGDGIGEGTHSLAWTLHRLANLAAALKGKFGEEVTHKLKDNHATNNMDSANSYAVVNIISVYVCVCV